MDTTLIGSRIKAVREIKGLTQEQEPTLIFRTDFIVYTA